MNRRMIAAALACLACTAGLSACSLTGTGDTHHIAVIIKHAGEHFQNVMAGAEACASEHPNVTIDIQFPSSADGSAEQLDLFRSALDDDSVDAVVISPMQSGQLSAAARLYVQAATDVPDETALEMPDLFKTWAEILEAGKTVPKDTIINDGGTLYRVVPSEGVLPMEHQPPHGEGMLAVYRPIDKAHTGTQEDPIPWVYGMDCTAGLYYSYNGVVYLCKADMKPCVWAPGTAGLWQWEAVT